MTTIPPPDPGRKADACPDRRVDEREQLVNELACGPVGVVSLPEELITSLHGVMFDIDLKWLDPGLLASPDGESEANPEPALVLYQNHARHWLDRDPVLRNAEVRFTGTGLHALLHIAPAVEFQSPGDRQRWNGLIRAIQCCLPTDPTAPALTALTRPLGSVNGKSGKVVTCLRAGTPVTPEQVRELYDRVRTKPFTTIAMLLYGGERVTPCPVCRAPGQTLAARNNDGFCYGGCGAVKVAQLLGAVMSGPTQREVSRGDA